MDTAFMLVNKRLPAIPEPDDLFRIALRRDYRKRFIFGRDNKPGGALKKS